MTKVYDKVHGIVPPTAAEKTELEIVHGAYFLARRGEDFVKWAYSKHADVMAKVKEVTEAEAADRKAKKAPKKPAFDKAKFEAWAKQQKSYLELVEKAKSIPDEEQRRKFLADEGAKCVKSLKSEFLKLAA